MFIALFRDWNGVTRYCPDLVMATPELAIQEAQIHFAYNSDCHPGGARAHQRYILDPTHWTTRTVERRE